jgi:hypothetical protein
MNRKRLWMLSSSVASRAFTFRCESYADTTVHVVLVWTDPPGNLAALKQLVNDLDLIVFVDSSEQLFGNMQSFPDTSNTVEKVVVSCPRGSTITAIVNRGSFATRLSQTFALVANGNVVSEFAQELTPVPFFNSGRSNPVRTSSTACSVTSGSRLVQVAAPLPLKPSVMLSESPLVLQNFVSQFTASLSMLLAVPWQSVQLYLLSDVPWIGFGCGAYVCSTRSLDSPCFQVIVCEYCNIFMFI